MPMDSQLSTFMTLSGFAAASLYLTDPRPAWIWAEDGKTVLWSNPAGAAFFGVRSLGALSDLSGHARAPARPHITRVATSGATDRDTTDRLRFYRGLRVMLVTCACRRLVLPGGQNGALIVALDASAPETTPLSQALVDLVSGAPDGGDSSVLVYDRDGRVAASSSTLPAPAFEAVSRALRAAKHAPARARLALGEGEAAREHDSLLLMLETGETLALIDAKPVEMPGETAPDAVSGEAADVAEPAPTPRPASHRSSRAGAAGLFAFASATRFLSRKDDAPGDEASGGTGSGDAGSGAERSVEDAITAEATDADARTDDEPAQDGGGDAGGRDDLATGDPAMREPVETAVAEAGGEPVADAPREDAGTTGDEDAGNETDDAAGDVTDDAAGTATAAVAEEPVQEELPQEEPGTDGERAVGPVDGFVFEPRERAARFAWKMDVERRFTFLSPEFEEALGPLAADIVGRSWDEVADRFEVDRDGRVAAALTRRDTWSGRTVFWPVSGHALRVPVDMAALPAFDRNRVFEGFRGFGVCRTAEAETDPDALGIRLAIEEMGAPSAPEMEPEMAPERDDTGEDDNGTDTPASEPDTATAATAGMIASLLPDAEAEPARQPAAGANDDATGSGTGLEAATGSGGASSTAADDQSGVADTLARNEALAEAPVAGPEDDTVADDTVAEPGEDRDASGAVSGAIRSEAAADNAFSRAEEPAPVPSSALEIDEDLFAPDVPSRDGGTVSDDETAVLRGQDVSEPDYLEAEYEEILPDDGGTAPEDDAAGDAPALPEAPAMTATQVPADSALETSRLSKPEREAFRKIAEALGVRTAEDAEAARPPADKDDATGSAGREAPAARSVVEPIGIVARPVEPKRTPRTSFLDKLPVGVAIIVGEDVIYANATLLTLSGYPTLAALQAAGGLDALFAEPEDWPSDLPGSMTERTMRLRLADGGAKPVKARLHSVAWNDDTALMMSLVDRHDPAQEAALDRLHEVQTALALAQEQVAEMDAVLETATDGVLILDEDGAIVKVNRSAEALFNASRDEMVGAPLTDYLAPESHRDALDYLDGLARNGVASVLNDGREVIGQLGSGGLIPLFMTIGRVGHGSDGPRFCTVLRDITQWKKAEEELTDAKRQAESASSKKSDFLAKISHEIRTPLNAIIGFSEVMMEERFGPVGNERYKGYLRDIHNSGSHIMSLINDLLDLSKIEAGKLDLTFEAVSANDIIRECVALMQPQANRERVIIRASLPTSVPRVVADGRSVRQIVLNLLSNAIKFNQPGGQVIVSTALEDSGEVILRVRDTGLGMSHQDLAAAMEPFRQLHTARHGGGTGLGLPLTKALVEANRASFRIDSELNHGTLIEITFPPQRVLAE